MTAINFPDNPTVGQSFSAGTRTWLWDGTVWANTTARDFVRAVSATAPENPSVGDEWFNSTNGRLYNYYDGYWIEIGASVSGPQGLPGEDGVINPLSPLQYDENTQILSIDLSNYYSSQETDSAISSAVAGIVDSAPETLNTLSELSAALNNDEDFATTVTDAIAGKANISHSHTLSDVTDVSATAQELNHLIGATSGIQSQINSKASLAGTETLTNKTLSNQIVVGQTKEAVLISTTGFAGYNFEVLNGAVQFLNANSTSNGLINFRASSSVTMNSFMEIGQSVTCVLLVTNGSTPYYPTSFQVDENAITPMWQGGTAPTSGNANSIDAYTFTLLKRGGNFAGGIYTLIASQTRFA